MSAKAASGSTAAAPATADTPIQGTTTAGPAPASTTTGGAPRPGASNIRGMADRMTRCLDMLGLKPGASIDEVNTTYFTILKRFPENPTEEDEARMGEMRRAYEILRRAYVPPQKRAIAVLFDRRRMVPLMGAGMAALLGVLLWFNMGTIKIKLTQYETGAVVRLKSASVPFGTIVAFDAAHRFPAGAPGPAYEIRLDGRQETIWVSERLVENGMTTAQR